MTEIDSSVHLTTMSLRLEDGVHILNLSNGDNDNLFTLDVLNEYLTVMDAVEDFDGNTALMICCDHEKTWCNGINLEALSAKEPEYLEEFRHVLETVFYRLAMLNVPTLACVNGNVYAGGALLYAACDFRMMREDRGRICYPEVDIKMTFTPLMHDIIAGIPNAQVLKRMVLLGEKFTGEEALSAGIVDAIYPNDVLQDHAFEFAKELAAKDRATYTEIKHGLKSRLLKWKETYAA